MREFTYWECYGKHPIGEGAVHSHLPSTGEDPAEITVGKPILGYCRCH